MATAKNLLILLLILILGFFVLGDPKYIGTDKVITKIDTLYSKDTIVKYKKGKDIQSYIILTDTEQNYVHDTIRIITEYNQVKQYIDTIRQDSNYFVITDTISKNAIQGRSFKAELVTKTITINNTIYPKPKNELYLGLLGDLRRFDNKIGVGVGLTYKKQKEAYMINFTTNQISLGLYKKLF
jgi:hypothetical protein